MTKPSDLNTSVLSVRVSKEVAAAFDARLAGLGIQRQHALSLAVACVAELADPTVRASLKPAWVALSRSAPVRERMLANGTYMAVRAHLECPGSGCTPELLANARGDVATDTPPAPPPGDKRAQLITLLGLPPGASDPEIVAAVQEALKSAQGGPPPEPLEEEYSTGLEAFERRDAAKIKDPEARRRFVASRLARKAAPPPAKRSAPAAKATSKQGCGGACKDVAGLKDFEQRDAAAIRDPEARKRFIASRLARAKR